MNISLLRNSALVHTHCASPRKKGLPLSMRKSISSFGGFSVKAFTNRDFVGRTHLAHAAAARSSLSAPRATIFDASSGKGRCNAFASSQGARIQTSHSSGVVKITGIAFGWIGSTIAFGAVVRKP